MVAKATEMVKLVNTANAKPKSDWKLHGRKEFQKLSSDMFQHTNKHKYIG